MTPDRAVQNLRALKRNLPMLVGNEIINFALDNWDKQGFQSTFLERWKPTVEPRNGRAILVGKQSGRMRRSHRIVRRTEQAVTVTNTAPYSGIHNEGGTLQVSVTARSRKFFWAMHYATGEDRWKYMALTKKTRLTITIPRRQFIGLSPALDDRIKKLVEAQLKKALT